MKDFSGILGVELLFNASVAVGSVLLASGLSILVLNYWKQKRILELEKVRPRRLIVITGCDSGLGLAMAYWAGKKGHRVLAGCYNLESDGAKFLENEFSKESLEVREVDVTDWESLQNFRAACQSILASNGNSIQLWALISNAAVAVFGEFFWMTENQSRNIMEVNFWGSVNLTKTFSSLLIQNKSRLILITSDCADFPLPGLSVYSASKAALENWASSLRLEVAKFGMTVTSFQPGNFPRQSSLFAGQFQAYQEMKRTMTLEDKDFYGKYFDEFHEKLLGFFNSNKSENVLRDDQKMQNAFMDLIEKDMKLIPVVSRNSLDLRFIHFLFQYLPRRASDWLKMNLLKPPAWNPKKA